MSSSSYSEDNNSDYEDSQDYNNIDYKTPNNSTDPLLLNPNLKNKLCCMSCSFISTDFKTKGCPNCKFPGDEYRQWSTRKYKGVILKLNNEKSWMAQWLKINRYVNGFYACVVGEELPRDYVELLEDEGKEYIDRTKNFEL